MSFDQEVDSFRIKSTSVGVIIGKFQVPVLHEAHLRLINYVYERHFKLIVLLGIPSEYGSTKEYPLSYESRKLMIREQFQYASIGYIKDVDASLLNKELHGKVAAIKEANRIWSNNVDATVSDMISKNYDVTLYGGRDSFVSCYSGRYMTKELGNEGGELISGTQERKNCGITIIDSKDFRKGVLWATENRE